MTKNLTGKVALVTGGSRGIGAAIAHRLADEGADVAISYIASADKAAANVHKIEGKGVRAAALKADQADPVQVEHLVTSVVERFGHIDILVNNAAVVVRAVAGDPANDLAALERQFAINVGGVAVAVRAAVPLLPMGGRIISIGSTATERLAITGAADYTATKAAIAGYTRGWARDLAPRGITVNLVQVGAAETEMNPADGPFASFLTSLIPLGRLGKPDEVAAAVAFLAGPEAGYITGTTLNIDGGITI
jgi:3-oxoacyl-[acyl-carrier protein] reductase